VIANNLAGVTPPASKSRPDFQDLMYQNLKSVGSPSATRPSPSDQIGLGSRLLL
jgi:flagellar basal-body rod protein FlgG